MCKGWNQTAAKKKVSVMPTYTYECLTCKTLTEKNIKMEQRDEAKCDSCNSLLKRKLDKPGMVWSPTRNNGHSF